MNTGHILIVEDEKDIRELLRLCIEGGGFRVSAAGGAGEARRLLQAEPPDLALLDVNLPDGDGMDLCKEIREQSDMPVIPTRCSAPASCTTESGDWTGRVKRTR